MTLRVSPLPQISQASASKKSAFDVRDDIREGTANCGGSLSAHSQNRGFRFENAPFGKKTKLKLSGAARRKRGDITYGSFTSANAKFGTTPQAPASTGSIGSWKSRGSSC